MMRTYVVVERVRETVERERTWEVSAISEQDAIRMILEGEAADAYRGKKIRLMATEGPVWVVDGNVTEYEPAEAIVVDDDFVDLGGHG